MFNINNFFNKGKNEEVDKNQVNEDLERTDQDSKEEVSEFRKNIEVETVDGKTVYKYKDTPEEPEYKSSEKVEAQDDSDDNEEADMDMERGDSGHRQIEDDDEQVR